MQLLLEWLIAFFLPATLTFLIAHLLRKHRYAGIAIVHAGLVISIILSNYFIAMRSGTLSFQHSAFTVSLFIASIIIAFAALRLFGLLYAISAVIQQLTIISITALLAPSFSIPIVILLIAPVYALGHIVQPNHWRKKILLTLAWGSAAVLLFLHYNDPFLNEAVHIFGGTLFIRMGVLYSRR